MLQLTPYLERLPRQLSGGQRQRVAIGRAIVRDPKVFLFDEPLSNLDAALRVATRLEIAKLHRSMHGTTMIYVTHDQVEAMTLADRICVLRDGVVEQVGTPLELYETPNSVFVAGFIGSPKMNFLDGRILGSSTTPTPLACGPNTWRSCSGRPPGREPSSIRKSSARTVSSHLDIGIRRTARRSRNGRIEPPTRRETGRRPASGLHSPVRPIRTRAREDAPQRRGLTPTKPQDPTASHRFRSTIA